MSSTGRHVAPRTLPVRPAAVVAAALVVGLVLAALVVAQLVRVDVPATLPRASAASVRFAPPAVVPAGSELVRTRVLASGQLRVDHWVRPSGPAGSFVLAVPPSVAGGVEARDVRVATDSGVQDAPTTVGDRGRRYAFAATSSLHVSYVLTGAVTRSGSVPGRALARTTSLELGLRRERLATTVRVEGGRLLAAACAPVGAPERSRPCGRAGGEGWAVSLPRSARPQVVAAQLDLD
ncbi:hypothetical protein SAMN04488570_0225 [Nocardioides scoriae]|uniref:Uncharacterized protein n=1 Tax=Nocardioides scoriae TaxID=642780 RepID=A0A1H1LID7_9ACTN|nr:hypothetical protein [Nocardioides scoriae]SDR74072.1 hypothetical protein SAMN04488570_0225 [Nocardioides scoriae]